ncbi:unnamed protein product [Pieris macdunnoughi]|uniref:Retrotransposon gag domain-containing protein n=1 Tax=Pieris macdunnoughi TaxID=345717 RepID=A0A821P8H4_9NEOP|nr:unnamed protein product [Pieris macdunnoughi]
MSDKSTSCPLPPSNFSIDINASNMPLAWRNFKTSLGIYTIANDLEKESDKRKVAILLQTIGSDALQIFYSFNTEIDKITYKDLLAKFEDYFTPRVNISVERHKLFNRKQGPDEEIETYATDLKNLSIQCNFEGLADDIVKDIFSWNLNSSCSYIRERILIEKPSWVGFESKAPEFDDTDCAGVSGTLDWNTSK